MNILIALGLLVVIVAIVSLPTVVVALTAPPTPEPEFPEDFDWR